MVSLVDVKNEPGDLAQLEKDLRDGTQPDSAPDKGQPPSAPAPEDKDGDLPDKFKGKSAVEIAAAYKELHSAYGRMANDLGTQRKLTDRLLDLKRSDDLSNNAPPPVRKDVSSTELLENPTATLDSYLEPALKQRDAAYQARLSALESSLQQRLFTEKHPDWQTVANSAEFVAYLQKSPFRQRLAAEAYNGNWAAADELITDWKSMSPAPAARKPADTSGALAAGLEAGSAADTAISSKGKVYRRADLIKLKMEKPHLYEDPALQAEILKAYAEGRVK